MCEKLSIPSILKMKILDPKMSPKYETEIPNVIQHSIFLQLIQSWQNDSIGIK